jgi:alanine racemase
MQSVLLNVNYQAIADNWLSLKKLGHKADCAAVVKANAYGLGAIQTSIALEKVGCTIFFVATLQEALNLKPHLQTQSKLYVFEGRHKQTDDIYYTNHIFPVLNSLKDIEEWQEFSKQKQVALNAILHIDSSMRRLGLDKGEFTFLQKNSEILKHLNLDYVMSHYSSADTPEIEEHKNQCHYIDIIAQFFKNYKLSLCNTPALINGFTNYNSLSRPGIGLYGGAVFENYKNVFNLYGRILQIRTLQIGEFAGYNATWQAQRVTKIATVACGYADGYKRYLSGKKVYAYLSGYYVPLVGRVSMDLTLFDVTDVPENILNKNNYIELIGDHISLFDIADQANTITYDILTGLKARV